MSVAVLHKWVDVIDGLLECASPCPSEKLLWLQGTLILECPEISSYQFAIIGRYGQGLPPVKLNFEYLKLGGLRPV